MTSTIKAEDFLPCSCKDYKAGIECLNGIIHGAANRRQYYTAAIFRFCPWCGYEIQLKDPSKK